ncbi:MULTISPECIES: M20 aminoacylase family protein [unclassified Cupriavidus]|uniref:M20 aminoacylase family protein n=1 Tax=unclassified Cupriavidus TaxID=2640874 RepID=UPI0010F94626|nr:MULTISPECIES: M20 aminoacylase family protein [unclassified Cupriavidus]MWL88500.1 amidohydrolase [Cupriavidus sp. SW-Y-13]
MYQGILQAITESADRFIEIRRQIHQFPEVGFTETRTGDLVAEMLKGWGYEVSRGMAKTGVVGTLKVGSGKKRVGIRADMDALPMAETSGKAWSSTVPGKFHGCGHDGHTAILLCAAEYLARTRNFDGTLHLIFQPAEELLYGGKVMVDDGLFREFPCDAIFAMHNMPGFKECEFYFREGAFMASSDTLHIEIHGVGGHGAIPEKAIDATLVACHIGTALQTIVSRSVSPFEAAVITIGSIQSGEAPNIINSKALMKLSVRSLNPAVRAVLLKRIGEVAQMQAQSFGATAEVMHVNGSPVLINGSEATDFAARVARDMFGAERVHTDAPQLPGSEDFAFMLEANPNGSYMLIGAGDEPGYCMVHNPGYDFNDKCLVPAAAYWCAITEAYLK